MPAATKDAKLSPVHKQWFERDVTYLITNEEKEAFLNLGTDAERENFIAHFWAIRNPTPGAPSNDYKEEIYRRIAYANDYFGNPGRGNGWRTDRGRAYIVLGPPKQRAPYFQAQQTKPMEIWFYENTNPALPPYFYMIFYQRDIGDEYRLYSPYFDGPDKLTTSVKAVNDRRAAFQLIDHELGREVSRTTLSLVPNEPVDINNATSSMESDLMLAVFKNLANHPLTKAALKRRADMLEYVSHRTVVDLDVLQVLVAPLRDASGDLKVHYALRLPKASDFTIAESEKGRYYNVSARVRVLTPDLKLIFEQEHALSKYLSNQEFSRVQVQPFGYEGWLPLAPGKYKVEFTLSNNLTKLSYRAEREISVPDPSKSGLQITALVPFSTVEKAPSGYTQVPFNMAGYKFTPREGEGVALSPGQDLKFFYQIWTTAEERARLQDQKLLVEYGYGQPGVQGTSKSIKEEVGASQFDMFGTLGNGKVIDLKDQPVGNYHLSVTVTDPTTNKKTFAGFNFHIDPTATGGQTWDVIDDELVIQAVDGTADYQRGLCSIAQGDSAGAAKAFESAIQKGPRNEAAREKLADLYYTNHDFNKVLDLYRGQVNDQTSESAILRVGDSYAKSGKLNQAVSWLESALKMKRESKPLDLALASYYQQLGNEQRANELVRNSQAIK